MTTDEKLEELVRTIKVNFDDIYEILDKFDERLCKLEQLCEIDEDDDEEDDDDNSYDIDSFSINLRRKRSK